MELKIKTIADSSAALRGKSLSKAICEVECLWPKLKKGQRDGKTLGGKVQRTRIEDIIKNIPFFAYLNEKEISEFKEQIIEKQFMKNQLVIHDGEISKYFYIIFSGKVKVIQLSAEGKERTLAIHKEGEFFGEIGMLDGGTTPATVIALEKAQIGLITKAVFNRYLFNSNEALKEIVIMLCGVLRDSWSMMKLMSFADAERKVKAVLNLMATKLGVSVPDGMLIDMKISHSDIANFASLTRETATRVINRLEKAKEIEITAKFILLKPAFYKNIDHL
ncbi:transcriptional regulator, Crp/Fnr family [Syntrophus gentianae]|uniref:Transcriptional regulator, Crp/Fnr family n=1 Tax=Syntrophus gentianae TaxID=43775 RepID=A0A1H7UZX6_9BACT|nr:Crp/Fnr family transcriptional regulator [Syntrophus gentianae]SEM02339.1 transcriptional regulator, Crp/Fnr family [Syntrophus gentianae]